MFTTALEPDEILIELEVPYHPPYAACAFSKESIIAGGSPTASVAVFISLDEDQDTVKEARIVLGGIGATPIRAREAEKEIIGKKAGAKIVAGEVAAREAHPSASADGSVEYKREIVKILTDEMINLAIKRVQERKNFKKKPPNASLTLKEDSEGNS